MTRSRRLACFLLGLWVGAGLWTAWTAIESVHSVDRLLARSDPVARLEIKELGPARARLLLEYEAAEMTRSHVETWEMVQILLGGFFFFFLLFGTNANKFALLLALLMLVAVLCERLLLTPELVALGRSIDFAPAAADRGRFSALRVVYLAIELFKWALGIVLAVWLVSHHRDRSANARYDLYPAANPSRALSGPRPPG